MPLAIPDDLRQQIWLLAQQQFSVADIAHALLLPARSVRHLLALFRQHGGPCAPRFHRCGRRSSFTTLHQQALRLRHDHSRWGAGRILADFSDNGTTAPLPHPSTVRRWLRRAGLTGKASTPAPVATASWASQPHQIWQMDAAECKPLRTGQKICWLRLVDEASAAVLFTRVFAQARWAALPPLAVQAALRDAFVRWGRPLGLRVDNGLPWVSPRSDLPSDLELWLAGLQVALHKNRPHVPQDNPLVERSQRTLADWAEPGKQDSVEQLQSRADEEDRIQREVYRFDGKQSRLEAYAELRWGGQVYALGSWEAVCWDHQGALGRLSEVDLERRADKDGRISLYDYTHGVGSQYRGKKVQVRLQANTQEWRIRHEGQEVRRVWAEYLGAEPIRELRVGRRDKRGCAAGKEEQTTASAAPQEALTHPPETTNAAITE